MKDLQNRIQQMLREKKTHSRAVALITALSLLMMIIVPDLSVIPGVAMEGSGLSIAPVPYVMATASDGTGDWTINANGSFNGVVNGEMSNALPFGQYITELTIGGQKYTDDPTIKVSGEASSLSIGLAYSLERTILNQYNTLKTNDDGTLVNPYLQFKINTEELKIDTDSSGAGNTVIDSQYSGIAGYYSISKTGYLTIRLTKGYP